MENLDEERESWVRRRPDEAGRYTWDRWETEALSAGVAPELAALGREVLLRALYRPSLWAQEGQAMLQLALEAPDEARRRWGELLEG